MPHAESALGTEQQCLPRAITGRASLCHLSRALISTVQLLFVSSSFISVNSRISRCPTRSGCVPKPSPLRRGLPVRTRESLIDPSSHYMENLWELMSIFLLSKSDPDYLQAAHRRRIRRDGGTLYSADLRWCDLKIPFLKLAFLGIAR